MLFLRVTALCLAAAMICSAIRLERPELATAVSLAAGVAVLLMLVSELSASAQLVDALRRLMSTNGVNVAVLKAAGIAVLSELGAQLCTDAGEKTLAGRITLASRVATLSLCLPMLAEIGGLLDGVLS